MNAWKRMMHAAAVSALLAVICAVEISAASVGLGTVNADGLRLRAGAGTGSSILTTLSKGSAVLVLEDEADGWYKVDYRAQQGYVSADYLDVSTDADAELGRGLVEADGSVLNVRSGPGTSYGRVAQLRDGAVVDVLGFHSGWLKIRYNEKEGYVSSEYMSLTKDAAPVQAQGAGQGGSAAVSSKGQQIVQFAQTLLGRPYVYGGNGPNSFDCSGFTKYVYARFGININRTASAQLSNGVSVAKSDLQPGDLIFFRNDGATSAASHVGIYVGGGQYIHASSDTRKVEFNTLNTPAHIRKYVGARRIV